VPPIRQQIEAKLREVVRRVEGAGNTDIGASETRENILAAARDLLAAVPSVYHPNGAVRNDLLVRFMDEFHAFTMQDFPAVLTSGFTAFELEPRYETDPQVVDGEYIYQNAWAADHVFRLRPDYFVDVGSQTAFCTLVSRVVRCIAIDARPTPLFLDNLEYRTGEAQSLPFDDGTVPLLTSLHAPEHFGLGRYGDTVDYHGTARALAEYLRVVAPGGHLVVAMPAGAKSLIVFNAVRVYTRDMMRETFAGCDVLDELFLAPDPITHEELVRRTEGDERRCGLYGLLLQKHE